MNAALLDPNENDVPSHIESSLPIGNRIATALSFSPDGAWVAVGCSDGHLAIVDHSTRGVALEIVAHVRPIMALRCAAAL